MWTARQDGQTKVRWLHLHFPTCTTRIKFQTRSENFSHIGPAIEHVKQKLQSVSISLHLNNSRMTSSLVVGCQGLTSHKTNYHFVEMDRLLKKYVESLILNIHNRFRVLLPVLEEFTIFDVLAIPSARSPGFKGYGGDRDINKLTKHFFAENEVEESDKANVNTEKLKAKWGKFKFDLTEWLTYWLTQSRRM